MTIGLIVAITLLLIWARPSKADRRINELEDRITVLESIVAFDRIIAEDKEIKWRK